MMFATVNPATGETLRTYEPHSAAEVERRLQAAADAFPRHRRTSFAERARMMVRAAEILESEREEFGRLMVTEMGKPIQAARDEAAKCALGCRYYAEHAERFLADEPVADQRGEELRRLPADRAGAGDHALELPLLAGLPLRRAGADGGQRRRCSSTRRTCRSCALAIEEIFRRAGFADGVFQTLLIETEQVRAVIEDPRVAAVTLTGSDRAGSAVASGRGQAIKKSVLELGGSDPFIVMPSADLERGGGTAVTARAINNGQSCIAAKRFIVAETVAEEFERRFVTQMAALKVGDPMDPATAVGPLASESQLKTLDRPGAANRWPPAPGCSPAAVPRAAGATSTSRRC